MRKITKIAIPLILLVLPSVALSYRVGQRAEINPVSKSVFEVIALYGSSTQTYWCGAGDYAMRHLGVGATQRVYLWAALGPSQTVAGKKAVQFSLSVPPSGPAPQSYSLSVKAVGDSLTAAAAQKYCFVDF